MARKDDYFELRLAQSDDDLRATQRLRYDVFVTELGSDGPLVDHDERLERDRFDPSFDHLMLIDKDRAGGLDDQVVGVYRLLRSDRMPEIGRYYSESEYDLSILKNSGRKLLELGRSCVHRDYRGGMALYYLWNGLSDYVLKHDIEVLFGVASFHGTDVDRLRQALSFLHYNHLAPEDLRVRAVADHFQPMNLVPEDQVDRKEAVVGVPALIKAYLRMGGFVGEGAFVDHDFNTTDVCLILDTAQMNERQRGLYSRGMRK